MSDRIELDVSLKEHGEKEMTECGVFWEEGPVRVHITGMGC